MCLIRVARTILLLWAFAHLAAAAGSGALRAVVEAPETAVRAGGPAAFSVVFTNPTAENLPLDLKLPLDCRLTTADNRVYPLTATPSEPLTKDWLEIRPGGYAVQRYEFSVPLDVTGPADLEVVSITANRVVLLVEAAPSTALQTEKPIDSGESDTERILRKIDSRFQEYETKLSFYEPMYFLVGTDPKKSKFQLSFKYRFFNPEGPLAESHPWVNGFHFGYTQTSFWDLGSESRPFRDTSYKPELFHKTRNIDAGLPGVSFFAVQSGFQHESNGRDGDNSRSTNFLYVKPIFIFGQGSPYAVLVSPKIWAYVANDDSTNPDLNDYLGYFELELQIGRAESFALEGRLWWAKEGGSFQIDFTYPLSRLFLGNLDLYFQAQYFRGYAESLLNYNERTDALRFGIAFIR
jgi:phospholipase A1